MLNLWRWIPHEHTETPLFAGGPQGADHCKKCGRFHFWMTEVLNAGKTDLTVILHFHGYGKALKSKLDLSNPRDQMRGFMQQAEGGTRR